MSRSGKKATGNSTHAPPTCEPTIEHILADGASPLKPELVQALEEALAQGEAGFEGKAFTRTACEAAMHSAGAARIICVRWHPQWNHPERGEHYRQRALWQPRLRLTARQIGSQEFIECRPFMAELTNGMLAVLEDALGRLTPSDRLHAYFADAIAHGSTAERLELPAVGMRRGTAVTLWGKYAGLWFGAARWTYTSRAPVLTRAEQGYNWPKLAIV